jgi:tetratricopeptide (TPR) repeat protein/glycosyltransferase involved in cell wall biosynthesis
MKGQRDLVDWFAKESQGAGAPLLLVQGPPGIGKSSAIAAVAASHPAGMLVVDYPEDSTTPLDDLLLAITEVSCAQGHDEMLVAFDGAGDIESALVRMLVNAPVTIVVDSMERAFAGGHVERGFTALARRIGSITNAKGRFVVVSDRHLDDSPLAEFGALFELGSPSDDEAVDLLDSMLSERKLSAAVDPARRTEVVRWLGKRPRAIRILVACLVFESLDDLIGIQPEAWELRQPEVSAEFLDRLERELVERTLKRAGEATGSNLRRLAVYRHRFNRDAIARSLGLQMADAGRQVGRLVLEYLVNHDRGWYWLDSPVREAAIRTLRGDAKTFATAHSLAADHFARHFLAKQLRSPGALAAQFVEAKYHLLICNRPELLSKIVARYGRHISVQYGPNCRMPRTPQELGEAISVLGALLSKPGPKGLEYNLARFFQARKGPRDLALALKHASLAVSPRAPAPAWVLLADLQAANGMSPDDVIRTLRRGFEAVPPSENLFSLYQAAGQILARMGRTEDAVTLLKEGIAVPGITSLASLYQAAGQILDRAGRSEDAVALLKTGIDVPRITNLYSLYQAAGEILAGMGCAEDAVALLEKGIDVPGITSLSSLYQAAGEILAGMGRFEDAVTLLEKGIARVPANENLFSLYQAAGRILVRMGRSEDAVALLKRGIDVPGITSLSSLYQAAGEILTGMGRPEDAVALLKKGIDVRGITNLSSLYQTAGEILAGMGHPEDAVSLLKKGIDVPGITSLSSLYKAASALLAGMGRSEDAVSLLKKGTTVPGITDLSTLYQAAGEILAEMGRSEDAVALLRKGIAVPGITNLYSLYQAAGAILDQMGRSEDAVALLLNGIARVPASENLSSLYQAAGAILDRVGRSADAVTLLEKGIAVPGITNLSSLYHAAGAVLMNSGQTEAVVNLLVRALNTGHLSDHDCRKVSESAVLAAAAAGSHALDRVLELTSLPARAARLARVLRCFTDGHWEEGARRAAQARIEDPSYAALACQEAIGWLGAGALPEAGRAYRSFGSLRLDPGSGNAWLQALLCAIDGDADGAQSAMSAYMGSLLHETPVPSVDQLLQMHATQRLAAGSVVARYMFPCLPRQAIENLAAGSTGRKTAPTPMPESDATGAETRIVLVVATEWTPRHGGLSRFNRQLCIAMADRARVFCLVPTCDQAEKDDASASSVTLVEAPHAPGLTDDARLCLPPSLDGGVVPHVVIGHGRHTGPAAKALCERFFKKATRVHFVHVSSEAIEAYKGRKDASALAEQRIKIENECASGAGVVAGVGPRLTRDIQTQLAGKLDAPRVLEFSPAAFPDMKPAVNRPPAVRVLVVARTEDYPLKGLDIAARAVGRAKARVPDSHPVLVVRGAEQEGLEDLKSRLLSDAGKALARHEVIVQAYNSVTETTAEEMRRSSVLLMPSRVEGYGLVALEAISAAVPILVTSASGVAEVIGEIGGAAAENSVVQTAGDAKADEAAWTEALVFVLRDRSAAFQRAEDLRKKVLARYSWDESVVALLGALSEQGRTGCGDERCHAGR